MGAIEPLQALGLTEYGARAYAALVGLGPSIASEIATAAQVPRTKIYAVLDELTRKGWAEGGAGRPKKYAPIDPAVRIEEGRRQLLEGLTSAETELSALYHQDGVRFGGPMWVLAGADAIQRRLQRMVKDARREAFVSLGFGIPGDDAMLLSLRDAAERGVRVRILVSSPNDHAAALMVGGGAFELRLGMAPLRAHFVDDKHGLVCFRKPREGGAPGYRGIWNPHAEMVAQLREATDQIWNAVTPKATRNE